MREITELDRYLFDLNGYVVVQGALSTPEVEVLNGLLDEGPQPTLERPDTGTGPLYEIAQPFRDLIDHPSVLPYLLEWIGPSLRADDLAHSLLSCAAEGSSGGGLHMGGTPFHPMAYYHFRDGHPHIGLSVVLWILADVPPGTDGGFCCIPGSHKSNYRTPARMQDFENVHDAVQCVPVVTGDAIIFTEALTHSRFAWRHPHQRRALFYRYTPGVMAFEQRHTSPYPEEFLATLTPRQRQMFEAPYGRAVNYEGTGRKVGRGYVGLGDEVVRETKA